ncbi:MAG: ATP-binding protein, partial [Bryobacteraceae bacterium]
MMIEQTLEKLRVLRLSGMVDAFRQQTENPDVCSLSFEERLGLLVDQHWTWRENKAMARRLKTSRLDTEPCVEDINYRYPRQLDGAKLRSL